MTTQPFTISGTTIDLIAQAAELAQEDNDPDAPALLRLFHEVAYLPTGIEINLVEADFELFEKWSATL